MKLVVECGATKSDWTVIDAENGNYSFKTEGLNFSSGDEEFIARTLEIGIIQTLDHSDGASMDEIFFYAAGLFPSEDPESPYQFLLAQLSNHFPQSDIHLENDLLAAARALSGNKPSIVCILGTGSNTCYYDGEIIKGKIPTGGFIIGDEGSASALGRTFISDYIKGLVPECIAFSFEEKYDLSYPTIVRNIYHGSSPAAYLGHFAPDILAYYEINRYMQNLVDENFRRFIDRCIVPCIDRYGAHDNSLPIGVVGSFGYACKEILASIAEQNGIHISKFLKSPSADLIAYHEND